MILQSFPAVSVATGKLSRGATFPFVPRFAFCAVSISNISAAQQYLGDHSAARPLSRFKFERALSFPAPIAGCVAHLEIRLTRAPRRATWRDECEKFYSRMLAGDNWVSSELYPCSSPCAFHFFTRDIMGMGDQELFRRRYRCGSWVVFGICLIDPLHSNVSVYFLVYFNNLREPQGDHF